eukprot:jgi/Mesvir1/12699/Mv01697-RA.1
MGEEVKVSKWTLAAIVTSILTVSNILRVLVFLSFWIAVQFASRKVPKADSKAGMEDPFTWRQAFYFLAFGRPPKERVDMNTTNKIENLATANMFFMSVL